MGFKYTLEDLLETADGWAFTSEEDEQIDVILCDDAKQLITTAWWSNGSHWVNSETRLPEIVEHGFLEYSKDVLIYESGNYRIAYLCFKESNKPDSGYRWVYDDYDSKIEGTYWMDLPRNPFKKD